MAVRKRKDAMKAQEDGNTPLLETDQADQTNQTDKYRDGCCRNGNCCSLSGLKCYSCYWMYCLCTTVAFWMFGVKGEWDCKDQSDPPEI